MGPNLVVRSRSIAARAARLARATVPVRRKPVRLHYGRDPAKLAAKRPSGGIVKIARLAETFPHSEVGFSGLYLSSQILPPDFRGLIRVAGITQRPTFLNQNGVAFPAWHRGDPEAINGPMREALRRADVVIYQSQFCRRSAQLFLGPTGAHEVVIENPVDTNIFRPVPAAGSGRRTLLLGGTQSMFARIETAVLTLRSLHDRGHNDFRLRITGDLSQCLDEEQAEQRTRSLLSSTGLENHVELSGAYRRSAAPLVFAQSLLLLHTAANDPCPNIVLEAMACGLPVVHLSNGGTPELVGGAGVAVSAPEEFEIYPGGDPDGFAAAVLRAAEDHNRLSKLARSRAERLFDIEIWIQRHRDLFAHV